MQHDPAKRLEDIRDAAAWVLDATSCESLQSFRDNRMLRQAVERNFEIMGEAINRLHKEEPNIIQQLSDFRRVISLRNIIADGYDIVDQAIIWQIIHDNLPALLQQTTAMLQSMEFDQGNSSQS